MSTNTNPNTPERLPSFDYAGWRLVSHRVNRSEDYIPEPAYDKWLIDVVEIEGDAWFEQAFEVHHTGEHFEIHAGPYYVLLSQHFDHQPDAVFDDMFGTAYLAALEAALTV